MSEQYREPDFSGVAQAWRVQQNEQVEEAHFGSWGAASGTLAAFLIHGPYHPMWAWWYVGLVHLREIEGAPPANRQYPEAEYEIMCLSIDPGGQPGRPSVPHLKLIEEGDIKAGLPGFLQPPDWVVQFHGVTDKQAVEVATHAARAISAGQSCDSDFRSWWERAIPTTVKHVRGEPH